MDDMTLKKTKDNARLLAISDSVSMVSHQVKACRVSYMNSRAWYPVRNMCIRDCI